jgi:hypothetical protein
MTKTDLQHAILSASSNIFVFVDIHVDMRPKNLRFRVVAGGGAGL